LMLCWHQSHLTTVVHGDEIPLRKDENGGGDLPWVGSRNSVAPEIEPAAQSDSDTVLNPQRSHPGVAGRADGLLNDVPQPQVAKGVPMERMVCGCAGLEVHKDSGEGCVRKLEPDGKLSQPTGHWGTTTGDFIALAEWMKVEGVTQVARKSTGVYRKPICNILEGNFEVLLDRIRADHLIGYHLKQLQQLGLTVVVTPVAA